MPKSGRSFGPVLTPSPACPPRSIPPPSCARTTCESSTSTAPCSSSPLGSRSLKMKSLSKRDAPQVVVITPDDARRMLEFNKHNRPLNDQHVRRIANQNKEGKWKFNGDTIKISEGNDILDGQHRLWAIFESGNPVETIVVRHINRDARPN